MKHAKKKLIVFDAETAAVKIDMRVALLRMAHEDKKPGSIRHARRVINASKIRKRAL